METPQLLIHRKSASFGADIPLFAMMRNEKYFLPHFLRHYRELGIQSFVICADRCDEEFLSMLEAEEDITILRPKDLVYGDVFGNRASGLPRRFTQVVKEFASNSLFADRWHLLVDADEFLVLPPPFENLAPYLAYLERLGSPFSFATMVDFYPERLAERNFDPALTPFQGSPFFDCGPYHSLDTTSGKLNHVSWGVRGRIHNALLKERQPDVEAILRPDRGYRPAKNYKFPLLKTSASMRRVGDHNVSQGIRSVSASAIAHFKFYPGLDQKIMTALSERQYFNGSVEYELIDAALRTIASLSLRGVATRRYRHPQDLFAADLLRVT